MKPEVLDYSLKQQIPLVAAAKKAVWPIGVVGSGSTAHALSAYLSSRGHTVSLLTRDLEKISALRNERCVTTTGKIEGKFKIDEVFDCPFSFMSQNEYIFLATVTNVYRDVIKRLAPYVKPHHKIILFSSKLGGCLEVQTCLKEFGAPEIPVLETDALFACKLQEDENVWIKGIKRWTLYSSTSKTKTSDCSYIIQELFPGIEPAVNLVQRGLTDFGALAHAPIMLANMNAVDRGEQFQFYRKGMTDNTIKLIETLASEFCQITKAYGAELIPAPELLNKYYGCKTSSVLEAMLTVPNYEYSMSPTSLNHRFLREDVSSTLVPASELAKKACVDTPILNSVIAMASVLLGENLKEDGRTLDKLGLDQLDAGQIKQLIMS